MQSGNRGDIERVWHQKMIPVVYRDGGSKPLLLRLPYAQGNYAWLRDNNRRKPEWDTKYKCWHTPKSWFNDIVDRCLFRFGKIYVIQPYREQEKCAPACWTAKGHECQCSCMGANHGSQNPAGVWFIASDAFAIKWHAQELACRLLTRKSETH